MTDLLGLGLGAWLILALAAAIVGFSKTAVSGASMVAIVLFASVLPVRESTGALLLVLLVGDLFAVWTYRRDAHWHLLRRLVAPVLVGLALGAAFLYVAPAALLRPVIGAIVVLMVVIQVWRTLSARSASTRGGPAGPEANPAGPVGRAGGGVFGAMAGFTTMVANAGGPVMTLYLLRSRLDVVGFVGTMAWFFFAVNLAKLPISLGLGLVQPSRFALALTLVPAVFVGALLGRALIRCIPKAVFEWTVLGVAGLSGLYLLFA